jgi:hypothetical protein
MSTKLTKPISAADTRGDVMLVHVPEAVLRAKRGAAEWTVDALRGSSVRSLIAQGWSVSAAAPAPKLKPPKRKAAKPAAPSFDVLSGTVAALKRDLNAGKFDASLKALRAAESGGKNRAGAIEVIEDRIEELD